MGQWFPARPSAISLLGSETMTAGDSIHAERLAKVEVRLENLQQRMSELKSEMDEIKKQQAEILEILTQAKGVQNFFRVVMWIVGALSMLGVFSYWAQIKAFLFKVGG